MNRVKYELSHTSLSLAVDEIVLSISPIYDKYTGFGNVWVLKFKEIIYPSAP